MAHLAIDVFKRPQLMSGGEILHSVFCALTMRTAQTAGFDPSQRGPVVRS